MKRLFCFLFLIVASQLDAALTVTNRGTFTGGGSSTSIIYVPTSTIAAGTLGVLLIATPNSGSTGATKIFTSTSFTDSVGNTWTRRLDTLYDPGAVSAGVELAAYTGVITTQVTTSDNVTVTISPTTPNRAAIVYEVSGANGTPTYVTSTGVSDGLTSGQSGTAVSVTSSSITSGDAILAWLGTRTDTTALSASDTDTTNGSWSTVVSLALAGRFASQTKVTTGTGTQTWDVTLGASAIWHCAWIQVSEASASSQSSTNGFLIWQ